MTEIRRCPGCGNEVLVPASLTHPAGDIEIPAFSVGCPNMAEHESGHRLVMWPESHDRFPADGGDA